MSTSRLSHRERPLCGPLMVGEKVQLVISCRATRASFMRRGRRGGWVRGGVGWGGVGRGGVRGVGPGVGG